MKKIGLLTWTEYENYGTYLQWYALNTVIKELNYDCITINYTSNKNKRKGYIDLLFEKPLSFIILIFRKIIVRCVQKNGLIPFKQLVKKHVKYSEFRKNHFQLTSEVNTSSELFILNQKFDAFICGSDQIWNPYTFDTHFFLDFVTLGTKKIAYAPSIGAERIDNRSISIAIKNLLSDFTHISIREKSGSELLEKIVNRDIPVVLDPTLLLSKEHWTGVADKKYRITGSYILCYFLGNNEHYWKEIQEIALEKKLELVVIPVYKKDLSRGTIKVNDVGPAQFISLIKYAELVLTDSYHGSIFSILFEKKFVVYKRFSKFSHKNQNTRIFNLLDILSLEEVLVTKRNSISKILSKTINFHDVNTKLHIKKMYSLQYLNNALSVSTTDKHGDQYIITNTCCGCGACAAVCPNNAIKIEENDRGFLHYSLNNDLCIKCNKCRNVCPFYTIESKVIDNSSKLFSAQSKSNNVLLSSSSGGFSHELINLYSKSNMSVTGCVYDSNLKRAITKTHFNGVSNFNYSYFQGSKYLQSNFSQVFKDILLSDGGLITGTPCQIAAIDNYLNIINKREDFLLVDLICHGVPSALLWDKYISEKSKKYNVDSKFQVKFRNKKYGWSKMYITLSNNKIVKSFSDKNDLFYSFFLSGNCYMEACYECNYRCSSSADIRIGDFWGDKYRKNTTGVSMVLAITNKGKEVLSDKNLHIRMNIKEHTISEYYNTQQTKNFYKPVEYDNIIQSLNGNVSLQKLKKRYCSVSDFKLKFQPLLKYFFNKIKAKYG